MFPTFFNPPEAIWNLVTPVATSRSVRPGFFNPSGHITVCQTGVFFLTHFASGRRRPYLGLTNRGFFNPSGHTTVCQTGFFYILDLDVNDHITVSQTESVVWSLTSYVKKVAEKRFARPWYVH